MTSTCWVSTGMIESSTAAHILLRPFQKKTFKETKNQFHCSALVQRTQLTTPRNQATADTLCPVNTVLGNSPSSIFFFGQWLNSKSERNVQSYGNQFRSCLCKFVNFLETDYPELVSVNQGAHPPSRRACACEGCFRFINHTRFHIEPEENKKCMHIRNCLTTLISFSPHATSPRDPAIECSLSQVGRL